MPARLLILDDEPRLRELYARLLSLEGYATTTAGTAADALKKLEREDFHLLVTDVRLPDANGIELAQTVRQRWPDTEVIVVTAYGNIPDGVRAMKNGASDYLTKGDSDDQIVVRVAAAVEKAELRRKLKRLAERQGGARFESLMGNCSHFRDAVALARKVAPTSATVLILGESGTGKELFAQAIHNASARAGGHFVALNCAAIPNDMLESELFGYRKGAFTGAMADKRGLLEEAANGTLFLDEIGEMPLEMQAKLLRVLEDGSFYKLGDTKPTHVDVRLLAATHQNLKAQAVQGRFREDLYYRLAVFVLVLKPLRERVADIPLLAGHFIDQFALRLAKGNLKPSPAFQEALQQYPWPGNIRELRNVMERATILAEPGEEMPATLLPAEFQTTTHLPAPETEQWLLKDVEQQHIARVLAACEGNRTKAAQLLGIGVATLYRKIAEYDL